MDARRLERLLPLAVFLFALLVRLPGLGWGLKNDLRNASLHPDEAPNFAYSRNVVPGLGQFTPGFYNYGTLYLTGLRVASDITTAYTGAPKTKEGWSWTDPSQVDWDWVARCNLAGRILSALAGAAAAAVAYALSRRVAGPPAGLLAGAFIAIAPAHVVHSRFQTPDILAATLIGGALYFAVRALDPRNEKARLAPATWCGLLTGLSASVKYTGILVLFALYAAIVLRRREGWLKEAAVATLVAALAFVATTPGSLLDAERFRADVAFEMQHTATGQDLFFAGTGSGFLFHLSNLWVGIGLVMVLMGIAGLGWAAYRRQPWAYVLIAFLVPYYLLIGRAEVKYMRYTFPLYVGLAAGFGYAVSAAQKRKGWDKAAVATAILGIGGIPGGGVRETLPLTLAMTREDPRDAAGRFLLKDGNPVGIARDPWYWSASLLPNGADPRSFWQTIGAEVLQNPNVIAGISLEGRVNSYDLAVFDRKPDRIVTTNFETEYPEGLRGRKDLSPGEVAQVELANKWLDRLKSEYQWETGFASRDRTYRIEDMDYVQPQVSVWKRKD